MLNMLTTCREHYAASAAMLDNVPAEDLHNASLRQRRQVYEAARFAHFMCHVLQPYPQVRPL